MKLTNWIRFTVASQDDEILIGLYNQALFGIKCDEEGNEIEGESVTQFNRFVIGLLFFNIEIFYR